MTIGIAVALVILAAASIALDGIRDRRQRSAKLAPHVLLCPWCDGSIGRHLDWCEVHGAGHRRPTTPHEDTRRVP